MSKDGPGRRCLGLSCGVAMTRRGRKPAMVVEARNRASRLPESDAPLVGADLLDELCGAGRELITHGRPRDRGRSACRLRVSAGMATASVRRGWTIAWALSCGRASRCRATPWFYRHLRDRKPRNMAQGRRIAFCETSARVAPAYHQRRREIVERNLSTTGLRLRVSELLSSALAHSQPAAHSDRILDRSV
jgi:hypothetical protein